MTVAGPPQANMATVFQAFVQGFDQLPLSNGTTLTCAATKTHIDKASEAELPFMLVKNGTAKLSEYAPFVYQVQWDLAITLKVKSEPGYSDIVIQGVLEDIYGQATKLRGLFVNSDTGVVVPFGKTAIGLYRAGKLTSLAFRGGPFVTSAVTRPNGSERAYGIADIVMHVEFLTDKDPTQSLFVNEQIPLGYATVFSVGTIPRAVDASYPLGDNNVDFKYQVPTPAPLADTVAQGRYSGADDNTGQNVRDRPPFSGIGPIEAVQGIPYTSLVKSVNVTPYAASLTSGNPTITLSAIKLLTDYSSGYVNAQATWVSSNPAVATVDANGNVTRVGAGSCTIQATYQNTPSNLVAITAT